MSTGQLLIEITSGITELTNRVGLKQLFSQFGEVDVCWIPPLWERTTEVSYVKFKSADAAADALASMEAGRLTINGPLLAGRYRPPGGGTRRKEGDV